MSLRRIFLISKRYSHSDICIIGGGIVGLALAHQVSHSPYGSDTRMVLIEASDLFKEIPLIENVYSNRVSSLTPTSKSYLFNTLGAQISPSRIYPYQRMNVWDAVSKGELNFDFTPEQAPSIVENHLVQESLVALAAKNENLQILNKTKVNDFKMMDGKPQIVLDNGTVLTTDLLVPAN